MKSRKLLVTSLSILSFGFPLAPAQAGEPKILVFAASSLSASFVTLGKVFEKEKIQLLRGPYGPYIKQGLRNYKLNKEQQEKVTELSIEEVKTIIEELKANPPKKSYRKKKV